MPDMKVSSVDAFLEYLEKERGYSHHSIRNYGTDLYTFCKYLDDYNNVGMNDFRNQTVSFWYIFFVPFLITPILLKS